MSERDRNQIEAWVAAGIISAAIGLLLLSKDKKNVDAALIGIILAAIKASLDASKRAKKTKIPLITAEDNCLYKVYHNGKKELIKALEPNKALSLKNFTLQ